MAERPPWRFYGRDKIKHKLARMLELQPDLDKVRVASASLRQSGCKAGAGQEKPDC